MQKLQCGCTTLHSAVGMGRAEGKIEDILTIIGRWENVATIAKIDVLVVDEISMCSSKLLTLLEAILRRYGKNKNELFGGVTVVVSGDPLQVFPSVCVCVSLPFFLDKIGDWPICVFFSKKKLDPPITDAEKETWIEQVNDKIRDFCYNSETFMAMSDTERDAFSQDLHLDARKSFLGSKVWEDLMEFEQEQWKNLIDSPIKVFLNLALVLIFWLFFHE